MTPHILSIDNFFPENEFLLLRAYSHQLHYNPVRGPDGVLYPGIGYPVPDVTKDYICYALTWMLGYKVTLKISAFRVSIEGCEPPHWVHSDGQVSRFALIVYMNPGPGGTAFVKHADAGFSRHPTTEEEVEIWRRDNQEGDRWEVISQIEAQPNRAVIMDASLMHAAIPRAGFGKSPIDGRLILWAFFD